MAIFQINPNYLFWFFIEVFFMWIYHQIIFDRDRLIQKLSV
jgi:hypothetical protein